MQLFPGIQHNCQDKLEAGGTTEMQEIKKLLSINKADNVDQSASFSQLFLCQFHTERIISVIDNGHSNENGFGHYI